MQGLEIKINVIKREREEKNYKIGHFWVAWFSDIRGRLQSLGRLRIMIISELLQANCFLAKLKWKADDIKMTFEECFHMRSWRPYWCPKTMKRQPCWCSKLILWELNSFLMQTLSFVPMNLQRFWPCEWKHSIPMQIYLVFTRKVSHIASFGKWEPWNLEMAYLKGVLHIFFWWIKL